MRMPSKPASNITLASPSLVTMIPAAPASLWSQATWGSLCVGHLTGALDIPADDTEINDDFRCVGSRLDELRDTGFANHWSKMPSRIRRRPSAGRVRVNRVWFRLAMVCHSGTRRPRTGGASIQ